MVLGIWGASLGSGVWQSSPSNLVLIMSIGGEKEGCGRQRRRRSRTAALAVRGGRTHESGRRRKEGARQHEY